MDLTTTIVKGYDLSGGAANWTSADLSDYTNYYLDFIWSNVTGDLDGSLLIRQTSDSIVYESIETLTIDSKDETRLKNNIGLSEDKINVKFTPNSITGGRLTIRLRAIESTLQEHKANVSAHATMRANLAAGNITMTGDLLFSGSGSGLEFGEISTAENATETAIASSGVKYQVTIFDTDSISNGSVTPSAAQDHISIGKAGMYLIVSSMTINSVGGAGSVLEVEIMKNNGASRLGHLHADRSMAGGGTERGSISMSAIVQLAVNDTVELWIENETNTQNYIVEDVTLSIIQIGG